MAITKPFSLKNRSEKKDRKKIIRPTDTPKYRRNQVTLTNAVTGKLRESNNFIKTGCATAELVSIPAI